MADLLLPANFSALYGLRSPIEAFAIGQGMNSQTVGVHTGDGDFLWKRYQPVHAEESIRYEHRLLGWLATPELPFSVPAPILTVDGDTLCLTDSGFGALFPFLPGGPVHYTEPRQLENVGRALAELHHALTDYPTDPRPGMTGFAALESLHPALPTPHSLHSSHLSLPDAEPFASLLAWWRAEVAEVQVFLDGPFQSLPRQVIHGDYGPSNTLHAGDQLTGIVDFEFAGPDVRALDVASGLYFSMRVWKGDDYWPRGEAFGRGYVNGFDSGNQVTLTVEEITALPWLMRLRNVVSKIFWLGKSLADGTTEEKVLEIGDLQGFNHWLAGNSERLQDLFGE